MNEDLGGDEAVVGIDVAKKKIDLYLMIKGKGKSKVFENKPAGHMALQRWLEEHQCAPGQTHVCLEATGPYSESLASALVRGGWKVSVVNPARVKGYAQGELARNKTDRADAALLARFCAAMKPDLWEAAPEAVRQLRAWVDRVQALKDMRQQERNRLEALDAGENHQVMAHVQTHIRWLDEQIAVLGRQIDDHIDGHPELKHDASLITSIPGIGDVTVSKVLAYGGEVRRFGSAKAFAAFIGICPRQRQSGSTVNGRTLISRAGHKALRQALYMPGLVARQHNAALKLFADRLRQRGMAPKAVIGAVMHKLAHYIYGVLKSGQPFDPARAIPQLDLQDGI